MHARWPDFYTSYGESKNCDLPGPIPFAGISWKRSSWAKRRSLAVALWMISAPRDAAPSEHRLYKRGEVRSSASAALDGKSGTPFIAIGTCTTL